MLSDALPPLICVVLTVHWISLGNLLEGASGEAESTQFAAQKSILLDCFLFIHAK